LSWSGPGATQPELAEEFEPSEQSIGALVKHADRDSGKREDGRPNVTELNNTTPDMTTTGAGKDPELN
jgi:hypothetical protein